MKAFDLLIDFTLSEVTVFTPDFEAADVSFFFHLHYCCNHLKCKMHHLHLDAEQKNPVRVSMKCRGAGCLPQRTAAKLSTALLSATLGLILLGCFFCLFFFYVQICEALLLPLPGDNRCLPAKAASLR